MSVLLPHPQTSSSSVRSVSAQVVKTPGDRLTVSYAIEGDLDRVRIPSPRPPQRAERLWQHTCCEIFVARKGSPAYHEFNFSPSGEWAAYAFKRYREGEALDAPDPGISVRKTAGKLELEAVVPAATAAILVGLSAVIEENDGRLSYWALRHAPGKPDFHHREAFALELG
jgi:hypothetical protein